jgi:hypothetical protein
MSDVHTDRREENDRIQLCAHQQSRRQSYCLWYDSYMVVLFILIDMQRIDGVTQASRYNMCGAGSRWSRFFRVRRQIGHGSGK